MKSVLISLKIDLTNLNIMHVYLGLDYFELTLSILWSSLKLFLSLLYRFYNKDFVSKIDAIYVFNFLIIA